MAGGDYCRFIQGLREFAEGLDGIGLLQSMDAWCRMAFEFVMTSVGIIFCDLFPQRKNMCCISIWFISFLFSLFCSADLQSNREIMIGLWFLFINTQ